MRITEVDKSLTQSELDQLEVFADRLFAKVGIDVEFTRHFLDRVNDERNVKQITASELTRLFKQEYKRWGKPIAQMGPDSEAVLKDLATDVNIPFALRWDKENNELDLIAKTVMRKKNFKTSNKEFEVQSVDYSLDNYQSKKIFESLQQLNEAAPLAIGAGGIAAMEVLALALGFAGAAALSIDIQQNPDKYNWINRKMNDAYMATMSFITDPRNRLLLTNPAMIALYIGKDAEKSTDGTIPSQAELDAAVETHANNNANLQSTVDSVVATLPADTQVEISDKTKEIIAGVEERAAVMDQQREDGVDPSVIAKTFIDSLVADMAENDAAVITNTIATTTMPNEVLNQTNDELKKLEGTVDPALQAAANSVAAQQAAAAEIAKMDAQNATADAKLIALANAQAEQNKINSQNATADAKLIALGQQVAQQKAFDKANALSDERLIALGQQVAQAEENARVTALSDAKLIAMAKAHAKTQADIKATELSDAKLIALGQEIAKQQAIEKANATSDAKLIALGKEVADAQATAAVNAVSDARLISIAQAHAKAQADAKADAQNTASDQKLIALGQEIAQQKIDTQNATSDAKLIALGQQVAQSQADAKVDAQNQASDEKLIALGKAYSDAQAIDKANAASDAKLIALAKAMADANDIEINVPDQVATDNDINIGTVTEPIGQDIDIVVPGASTGTNTGTNTRPDALDLPGAGAVSTAATNALSTAQSTTADPNANNNNNKKQKKKKNKKWSSGEDGEYWDTDLRGWVKKYGTFESQDRMREYFTLNEGGAMPGVGAIHIDEITPTLQALEKSIGIDLMNNTLGSVGKREFSGDIDVALQIQPEELPAFIEELKKNPLVLDIAKSSVIMTKIKIMDFDKSKSDGRPRTGFVQVDFMPGDPGWMKTYYHSPSEKESKYKGVYRNIMIATLAAVHNREQSDAKLDDGRALEERRFMWSPTEGLLRVQRTPVPKKSGEGYTKKNKNETIEGPWKQPDEIAQQLGLDSGKDLNSFESLWTAVKKNWTKEKIQYVIDGFKQNNVVQDIGVPEELDDVS